ncbi:hypothetical protein JCM10207_002687 [Rhodosporidiobolus poonsookiae]
MGEGDAAACGTIFSASSNLLIQGDSVSTNANTAVKAINEALGGRGVQHPPAGDFCAITNATPQCKCDLSNCLDRLSGSSSAAQAGLGTLQASCAQTCAPYYSNEDINQVVPECSQFEGTTNGRARRSIKFNRE